MTSVELSIDGMTCASCAHRIEKKLNKLDGVTATVNFATEKARVEYGNEVTPEQLVATVEDAGSSWATLYLRDSLGAPGPVAAFGYVALVGFMFVGRLVGDRLVDRFGERAVVRTGGFMAAAGMGCALAFPSVPGTIAGFAAAGLGVATLIPAAMHAADQLPGMRPGTGLTAVTWLMRVGFFGAPLIVGVVADATSLRVGLLSVPIAGLTAVALAGALSARRRPSRS